MRRIFFTSVVVTIVSTVISTSPVRSEDAVEKDAEGFFKKLDQDQDGKLTGKDFDENRKAFFERLVKDGDKNADGELTFEEFQTTNKPEKKPQGTLGMAPKRPGFSGDPAEHFRRLDADQNGKLTKEEMPERMQSRISKIMERMGKTELSQEDFVKIAERMQGKEKNRTNPNDTPEPADSDSEMTGPEGPRPSPKFLALLDKNDDGMISKEEFAKINEEFDQLDVDHDGQLSPREFMSGLVGPPPGPGRVPPREMEGRRPKGKKKKVE